MKTTFLRIFSLVPCPYVYKDIILSRMDSTLDTFVSYNFCSFYVYRYFDTNEDTFFLNNYQK